MAHKMTQKEFKDVLSAAGMDFSTWGYEGILNLMCIAFDSQGKDCITRGSLRCAEMQKARSDAIFKALNARGYYNHI